MTVDHAGRAALLLFECAKRVITTSAARAHARLISSELRFRLYCPTRVPETRLSFPPGVIASLNAQIIPIVFFRDSLYPRGGGWEGELSLRVLCPRCLPRPIYRFTPRVVTRHFRTRLEWPV